MNARDSTLDAPGGTDVAVVGAGVAGLTCALALARLGLRVEVFERERHLGGRAASWKDRATGDAIDIGPHVVTTEHRNFLRLLESLGTRRRIRWQPEPMITLLDEHHVLRIHSWRLPTPLQGLPNLRQTLRRVGLRDVLSNVRVAALAAPLDEAATLAYDRLDALSLLREQGVSQRFIDWFWTPTCLALLNVPLERCSAAALLRLFRLMLGRSGYHFGFPDCGLSELYAEPARAAIEAAGGCVRRRTEIVGVVLREGRFIGLQTADGATHRARCTLLALPPDALGALRLPWTPRAVQRFEPSAYVSTVLWFDRRITTERFWARIWKPGDLNMDFYDLANIRSPAPRAGSVIASNAIHARAAFDLPDAEITSRTLAEIVDFAPSARTATLRHAVVHRIPLAVPCPVPGSERLRPTNRTRLDGLWIAGDWTRTGLPASMESAARSGALAAEEIAVRFGHRVAIAEPAVDTVGAVGLLRRASTAAPA